MSASRSESNERKVWMDNIGVLSIHDVDNDGTWDWDLGCRKRKRKKEEENSQDPP